MRRTVDAFAVAAILVGFLLFTVAEVVLAGSLLVAGGTYALILPQFIQPTNPAAPSRP